MVKEEVIEYVHFFAVLIIDIAVLSGAVQRNGNKVHGLRGAESYRYPILQSLCRLLNVRSESTRVPILSDSGCLNKLDSNLSVESCCYNFRFSVRKKKERRSNDSRRL